MGPWQASYECDAAELDAQLDSQQRDAAWRKGMQLSAEEAVEYALTLNGSARRCRLACGHIKAADKGHVLLQAEQSRLT